MKNLMSLGVRQDGERLVVSSRVVAENFEKPTLDKACADIANYAMMISDVCRTVCECTVCGNKYWAGSMDVQGMCVGCHHKVLNERIEVREQIK